MSALAVKSRLSTGEPPRRLVRLWLWAHPSRVRGGPATANGVWSPGVSGGPRPTAAVAGEGVGQMDVSAEVVIGAAPQAIWQVLADFGTIERWGPRRPCLASHGRCC